MSFFGFLELMARLPMASVHGGGWELQDPGFVEDSVTVQDWTGRPILMSGHQLLLYLY